MKTPALSEAPAAERMRLHRRRRRHGIERYISLPIHVTVINRLIRTKVLKEEDRANPFALQRAVLMLMSMALYPDGGCTLVHPDEIE